MNPSFYSNFESFCPFRATFLLAYYLGRCPRLGASAPSGRIGLFQPYRSN